MTSHRDDFLDALSAVVDGDPAALDHFAELLADSDELRDLEYEARKAADEIAVAGADYEAPEDMESRVLGAIDARSPYAPKGAAVEPPAPAPAAPAAQAGEVDEAAPAPTAAARPAREASSAPAPRAERTSAPSRRGGGKLLLLFGAVGGSMALAAAAVLAVIASGALDGAGSDRVAAPGALGAQVVTVARAAADGLTGIEVRAPGASDWIAAGPDAVLEPGASLRTDERTRARLQLTDGSVITLNHASEVTLTPAARTLSLARGELMAEVAHIESGPRAIYETPTGQVEVLGTKFILTAADDTSSVRVTRGVVSVRGKGHDQSALVHAGQEGLLSPHAAPEVAPATNLASQVGSFELGDELEDDLPVPGIGELRAKRPGEREAQERPLHLAHHKVSVRIAGNVARTEIEETFQNDSPHVLEGIYRFPLPPDARIASLQLEVDGNWEQGAFVERDRAQKIWRGVIRNATPQARRQPQEEFIWVPGPWRDPALLEWQRGGRFELRIFPIPARGARHIRLSYEQTVQPQGRERRYVYPLAHSADDSTRVGNFEFDARVAGVTEDHEVSARGYEMESTRDGDSARRLRFTQSGFMPNGNLIIDYRNRNDDAEMSWWTFQGEATVPPADNSREQSPETVAAQRAVHADQRPYVVFALRPNLPAWTERQERDYVVVVDASQSMVGERFDRATALASGLVGEMDRRDRFTLLACDATCQRMNDEPLPPSGQSTRKVTEWLGQVRPAGASDVVATLREAADLAGRSGDRDVRIVYIGDGLASTGHRLAGSIAAEVEALASERLTVTTVGIGADADSLVLAAAARAGRGHYVPFVPGQRTAEAALAVLETTYGVSLADATLEMPDGVVDVVPAELPTIRAGEEVLVVGRLASGAEVRGDVRLTGRVGGREFTNAFPVTLTASTAAGNAFVPRVWAAKTIEELELGGRGEDRPRIVALSKAYGVMSRHTSLLVLESEAMFRAFGVDRNQPNLQWTGEEDMEIGQSSGTEHVAEAQVMGALSGRGFASAESSAGADLDDALSGALGGERRARRSAGPAPAPAATPARRPRPDAAAAAEAPPIVPRPGVRPRGPGSWMRRVWFREGEIATSADATPAVTAAVARAEAALRENPDSRDRHRDLVQALSRAGELERAREAAAKWIQRDQLDPEALTYLADVLGRLGRRDESIRLLSGVVDLQSDSTVLHTRLAQAFERAGKANRACSHRVALAEISPDDVDAVAAAMRCERALGHPGGADRLRARVDDDRTRQRVDEALAAPVRPETVRGNIVLDATWSGGSDIDLSLITTQGTRLSWMGGRRTVVGQDASVTGRERLGLTWAGVGTYVIEVSRATPGDTRPVSGTIAVTALGARRNIPFVLNGERATVGRVQIVRRSRMEAVPF